MNFSRYTSSYPTARRPTMAANVVSTSQPLAAQAGLRMLLEGGNAVDAALGAAIALTIVEPISNGIGSDLFAIIWDGNGTRRTQRFGPFAGRVDAGVLRRAEDGPGPRLEQRVGAGLRGGVGRALGALRPAAVREAVRAGDRLRVQRLPRLAVRGTALGAAGARAEETSPASRRPSCPAAGRRTKGERFTLREAAATLELIAETRGKAFYEGELAERIEAHAAACEGAMTRADLAGHTNDWVGTITQDYRGYTVHEIPPNGQGIVCLMALGMLSHFDVAKLAVDSPDSVHLQIEAVKLAFADARAYVADGAAMTEVKHSHLLDRDYLASRARLIDMKRAQDFGHGTPPRGGTIYLTAADANGMMVSLIQSNYMGFGSGVVVPGTGISLQNRGYGFVLKPGHPNQVAPRKRPYHTIIPGFVTKNGVPVMSFGLMGGTMQPQGHTQLMVRMIDYGQSPQSAIDGPRFRVMTGMDVNLETAFPPATVSELARRGHRLVELPEGYMDFGCAQIALRVDGGYVTASDPRRDSLAVGF